MYLQRIFIEAMNIFSMCRKHEEWQMRLSLTHKYVGSLFSALITCCAVVLFVSIYYMKKPIDEELSNSIHRMQNIVHSANEMTIQRFAQNAAFIATNDRLARAMAYKDHDEVFTLAEKAMKRGHIGLACLYQQAEYRSRAE
mgnify:CR=1 FL=1